jgi:hypothetical protein
MRGGIHLLMARGEAVKRINVNLDAKPKVIRCQELRTMSPGVSVAHYPMTAKVASRRNHQLRSL